MIKPLYYCIVKHYKGLFRKRFLNNLHLFILPRTDYDYLYLALMGERTDSADTHVCIYITRIPDEILNVIIMSFALKVVFPIFLSLAIILIMSCRDDLSLCEGYNERKS